MTSLSIPKLQRCNRWDWECISNFIPHFVGHMIIYPCDYLLTCNQPYDQPTNDTRDQIFRRLQKRSVGYWNLAALYWECNFSTWYILWRVQGLLSSLRLDQSNIHSGIHPSRFIYQVNRFRRAEPLLKSYIHNTENAIRKIIYFYIILDSAGLKNPYVFEECNSTTISSVPISND